jgi:protein SCO1/2
MKNSDPHERSPGSLGWTLVASACVALMLGGSIWKVTAGLRALALDDVKKVEFAERHAPLPHARLSAENGQQVDARQLGGRVSVVEFIYTRCTTVCSTLGSVLGAVQREFPEAIATGRLQLLSISFDLAHDDAAAMAAYRGRFGTPEGWLVALPDGPGSLRTLQQTFGFLIQDTGEVTVAHSSKLYLISSRGEIVGAFDVDERTALKAAVHDLLRPTSAQGG